ncbi:MAG: ATP-binding protein [Melioribacteraceae bacterium]|nr:ATP-binding protein [Melioribacteraceae bacterium]
MKHYVSKIGFKLISVVGATSLIIIGVYGFIAIKSQQSVLLDEVERHGNQLSEAIKKSMHFEMLANNRESIHNMINTIGEEPSIKQVRIFNKAGEIIYSAENNDIGKMVDMQGESCFACHAKDEPLTRLSMNERTRIFRDESKGIRVLGIINPIYNEVNCYNAPCHAHTENQTVLGVLDITLGLEDIDKQISKSELNILLFSIISIVGISLIIIFFIRRWVVKPVSLLVTATKNVAAGNLQYTIDKTQNDELGMLATSFNNMTHKLAEARMQLFQSDKMASLGKLAAGVAHEINNPLTGVLTYSSFLLKRTKDNPEFQEDLKVIVRETKRSREIVKGLLDFARQSVPKKNKADINEIIDRAYTVIENQLTMNKVKFERDYQPDLPTIIVDSNQMQQVFINLIVNASDAIGSGGGNIKVSTKLIELSPFGVIQIKKAECGKRHNLLDDHHKIDGLPSIKLLAKQDEKDGLINLNATYGKKDHDAEMIVNTNKPFSLECPTCSISLLDENEKCPECNSPIYKIETPGEGQLKGCINKNCYWQLWLQVESSGRREFIQITIEDNGSGIPQENLSKIFDPFFSTKGQKGTGLGLAVIWGIIDNHDGNIKVESKVNVGTKFIISLPMEPIRKQ